MGIFANAPKRSIQIEFEKWPNIIFSPHSKSVIINQSILKDTFSGDGQKHPLSNKYQPWCLWQNKST